MWTKALFLFTLLSCALAQVQPKTKPVLSVKSTGGNTVTLKWVVRFPAYGTVFFIDQAKGNKDFVQIPDVSILGKDSDEIETSYTYTVTDLLPDTKYRFRIAVDGFPNLVSDEVSVRTAPGLKVCGLFPLTNEDGEENPAGIRFSMAADAARSDVSNFFSSVNAPVALEWSEMDTTGTRAGALEAMTALNAENGCKIFIGPYSDEEISAVSDLAEQEGYTIITPGASSIASANKNVFTLKKDDSFAAHALARKIREDGKDCVYGITGSSGPDGKFAELVFDAYLQTNIEAGAGASPENIFSFNDGRRASIEEAVADLAQAVKSGSRRCRSSAIVVVTEGDLDKVLIAAFSEDIFLTTQWYGGRGVALNPLAVGDEASASMARLVKLSAVTFVGTWYSSLRTAVQESVFESFDQELEPEVFLTYDALWLLTPEGILDTESASGQTASTDDLITQASESAVYSTGEAYLKNYRRCSGSFGMYEVDGSGLIEEWAKSSFTSFYDCKNPGSSGTKQDFSTNHRLSLANTLDDSVCVIDNSGSRTVKVTVKSGFDFETAQQTKNVFGTTDFSLTVCRGACSRVCKGLGCDASLCSDLDFSVGPESCNGESGAAVEWKNVGNSGPIALDSYSIFTPPNKNQEAVHTLTLSEGQFRNERKVNSALITDIRNVEQAGAVSCRISGGRGSCSAKGGPTGTGNKKYKDYTPEVCALQKRTPTPIPSKTPSFTPSFTEIPTATPTPSHSASFTPSFTPSFTQAKCEHLTEICLEDSNIVVGALSVFASADEDRFDVSYHVTGAQVTSYHMDLNDDNACDFPDYMNFPAFGNAGSKPINSKTFTFSYRDVFGPTCGENVYGQLVLDVTYEGESTKAYACAPTGNTEKDDNDCNEAGPVHTFGPIEDHCCIPPTPTPSPTPVSPDCQIRAALIDESGEIAGEIVMDAAGIEESGRMPVNVYGVEDIASYTVFLGSGIPDVSDETSPGWLTKTLATPNNVFAFVADIDEHAGSDCGAGVNFLLKFTAVSGAEYWAYGPYTFVDRQGFTFIICCA